MGKEYVVEIDENKKYNLGSFSIEQYCDKYIIIKKNKWIVLDNINQLNIFKDLSVKVSLIDIFNKYNPDDIINVLTQIEAKKFEHENLIPDILTKGAYIYLTKKCNMRCPHCYMDAGKANENELTTLEIKKILDNLKKLNYTHITYTGGEIFLRKDLPDILFYSKKLGLQNILLTNGVLIKEEILEQIHNCIDEIQISIDGYNEETNAKIRGIGNFDKALNSIRMLSKYNIKTGVAITPQYEEVFNNPQQYKIFAKELLNQYPKNLMIKFSSELLDGRDFKADISKNKKYKKLLKNIINELYPDEESNNFALNYIDGNHITSCGFGEITINSDGNIYLCNLVNKLTPIQNIRDLNFELDKIEKDLDEIKEKINALNIVPCKECSLNYICGGGCRIKYLSDIDHNSILHSNEKLIRNNCSKENKEYFFNMMIKSNEYLYCDN